MDYSSSIGGMPDDVLALLKQPFIDYVASLEREVDALRADRDRCVKNMNDAAERCDALLLLVQRQKKEYDECDTYPTKTWYVRSLHDLHRAIVGEDE